MLLTCLITSIIWGHFFYFFSDLDDRHYFLYDTVHYLVLDFYVVLDLPGCTILHPVHYFLDYPLHFDHLGYFDYLFDYLFDVYGHFHYFFDDFLYWHNLLASNLDFFEFCLNVVHDFLYLDGYLFLDDFFFDYLDFHHL